MSTNGLIIIVLIVLSPLLWFVGGFIFKILWWFAPALICLATAGLLLWEHGLGWFLVLPVGLMLGIAVTWLWQRSRLFLAVDRWVEIHIFFDK